MTRTDPIQEMAFDCLMGRARLVTRVITAIYETALRPFGLKATQLNLLGVVAQEGPVRRSDIGKLLRFDPSTLTRTLQVMLTNGWIEELASDEDGRGLPLQATGKGRALLMAAWPAWRNAQREARSLVGDDGAALLTKLSSHLLTGQR
jgi:DNA-binding MarR family transcriptional regulator